MTSDGTPADITPATPPRRVVVGYDGSAGSRAALERAVDAARDAGFVFVVHAYARPQRWLGPPQSKYQERLDPARDDAEATIRELREQTGGPLDRVAWVPEIIGGNPAKAIAAVAAARHADEIVVGSRSFSLARALHGSVAHDLIRLAHVPVTVVPRGTAARPAAEAA
jgi:nucleotide-binding universal stress UspA family protein